MATLEPVPDPPALPAGPFDLPVDGKGLTIPRIRVVPMVGEPWEVQALNPDLLLYEDTAATHRWRGGATEAPFRWLTFLAWAASKRTGVIGPDWTWERFRAEIAEIADAGGTAATPTRPGPVPG